MTTPKGPLQSPRWAVAIRRPLGHLILALPVLTLAATLVPGTGQAAAVNDGLRPSTLDPTAIQRLLDPTGEPPKAPESTVSKPQPTPSKPAAQTPKPTAVAPKPTAAAPKQSVTAPEPVPKPPEQARIAPKPAVTAPTPAAVPH
ncbi:MAG: hypothetical protein WBM97_20130, partial [Sedimenticolaceae bacterium]